MFVDTRNDDWNDYLRQISCGAEIAVDYHNESSPVPPYSTPYHHRVARMPVMLTNAGRSETLICHSPNSHLTTGKVGFRMSTERYPILNSKQR